MRDMESYWICFTLESDATFGRGEGVAGLVDQEVDHDSLGLPYLKGRTLKGLLNEECANILFALEGGRDNVERWLEPAQRLLGSPGSRTEDAAWLHIGPARLPADLRHEVHKIVRDPAAAIKPPDVLDSLTAIRHQTAVDEATGAPDRGTLRAMRVVLRQTPFEARLTFPCGSQPEDLELLAACTVALRRAGTGRNRGRGRLRATLHADDNGQPGKDITKDQLQAFAQEVRP
jgi:hypothetical protein